MTVLHVFKEHFPRWFVEHVTMLETDTHYRDNWQMLVRAMPYDQWLQSPKWKQTATLQRKIQPYCQLCGTRDQLEADHKSYTHLGIEVLHMNDLQTLCRQHHWEKTNGVQPLFFGVLATPRQTVR